MTRVTPLLRFLRALNPDDRAEFAANAATTVVYLYQLTGASLPGSTTRHESNEGIHCDQR